MGRIKKSLKLISEGKRIKDVFILSGYFITRSILGKRKANKILNKKIKNIMIKSDYGIFNCSNEIALCWGASSMDENDIKKHFNINEGVFIDIGANIGKYSILLGKKRNVKVYSFEPHPTTFNLLKSNAKKNNIKDIHLENFGLGDKRGDIFLYLDPLNPGRNSMEQKLDLKKITVKIKKLDDYNIKNVKLIKIDVEGFEPCVLRGAEKIIKENKPKIIFEAWDSIYLKKIKIVLDSFNYEIHKINKTNFFAIPKK